MDYKNENELKNILYFFTKKQDMVIIKELYDFIYELKDLNKGKIFPISHLIRSIEEDKEILPKKSKFYSKYFGCASKKCKESDCCTYKFRSIYTYIEELFMHCGTKNKKGQDVLDYILYYSCNGFMELFVKENGDIDNYRILDLMYELNSDRYVDLLCREYLLHRFKTNNYFKLLYKYIKRSYSNKRENVYCFLCALPFKVINNKNFDIDRFSTDFVYFMNYSKSTEKKYSEPCEKIQYSIFNFKPKIVKKILEKLNLVDNNNFFYELYFYDILSLNILVNNYNFNPNKIYDGEDDKMYKGMTILHKPKISFKKIVNINKKYNLDVYKIADKTVLQYLAMGLVENDIISFINTYKPVTLGPVSNEEFWKLYLQKYNHTIYPHNATLLKLQQKYFTLIDDRYLDEINLLVFKKQHLITRKDFICPVSGQVMISPVMDSNGINYQEAVYVKGIEGILYPNTFLKNSLIDYLKSL